MKKKDDKEDYSLERILIGVALILCAVIIAYNVLYEPDVEIIEFHSSKSSESLVSDEEYIAYSQNKPGVVNINTAGTEELKTLDGVGDATAQAIIDYREAAGGFKNIEQILEVKGIGESKYSSIRDFITVE